MKIEIRRVSPVKSPSASSLVFDMVTSSSLTLMHNGHNNQKDAIFYYVHWAFLFIHVFSKLYVKLTLSFRWFIWPFLAFIFFGFLVSINFSKSLKMGLGFLGFWNFLSVLAFVHLFHRSTATKSTCQDANMILQKNVLNAYSPNHTRYRLFLEIRLIKHQTLIIIHQTLKNQTVARLTYRKSACLH